MITIPVGTDSDGKRSFPASDGLLVCIECSSTRRRTLWHRHYPKSTRGTKFGTLRLSHREASGWEAYAQIPEPRCKPPSLRGRRANGVMGWHGRIRERAGSRGWMDLLCQEPDCPDALIVCIIYCFQGLGKATASREDRQQLATRDIGRHSLSGFSDGRFASFMLAPIAAVRSTPRISLLASIHYTGKA